jgi:hypothetical protein
MPRICCCCSSRRERVCWWLLYSYCSIHRSMYVAVKKSELDIWSLQFSNVQRIPACNWVLAFLKHHQSTHYGWKSLFA